VHVLHGSMQGAVHCANNFSSRLDRSKSEPVADWAKGVAQADGPIHVETIPSLRRGLLLPLQFESI
jgi:hypothetical protein